MIVSYGNYILPFYFLAIIFSCTAEFLKVVFVAADQQMQNFVSNKMSDGEEAVKKGCCTFILYSNLFKNVMLS
jgi:hypothetical protein